MLTQLSIRNIVLIDRCEIEFGDGLCVLTGETGAGKSILLDALGLVLGGKADSALIRHGEAQAQVAAEFDVSKNPYVRVLLEELGLEAAESLLIRRTLEQGGKSRCHINDQAVSASALKQIGEHLVELHGQHDQRGLMDASTHRALLDEYGGLEKALGAVGARHQAWKQAAKTLEELQAQLAQSVRELDYLQHMQTELAKLNPQPGEEESLAETRTRMMQSEKLYELLGEVTQEFSNGKGISGSLRGIQRNLMRSGSPAQFAAVIEMLERAANETDEAQAALEVLEREATYDPQKLEAIEERLFALKAAGRKYHISVEELPKLKAETDEKLNALAQQEAAAAKLHQEVAAAKASYREAAGALSEAREKSARKLEKIMVSELAPLKMEGTKFRVSLTPLEEHAWSSSGMEAVAFEAATNVTKTHAPPFAALSKIASGGELSRFMLAMKAALSAKRSTSVMIFDEVDTGTGGAVADAIGARLARLGENAQVLVVTHLPQVAARGSQHLLISKSEQKGKVTTQVQTLSKKEREDELARMLAGAKVTVEARKAAQRLLEEAA